MGATRYQFEANPVRDQRDSTWNKLQVGKGACRFVLKNSPQIYAEDADQNLNVWGGPLK